MSETAKHLKETKRELPNGWHWVRLGEVASTISKGTTPTTLGLQYTDVGIPFLRAEDVNGWAIEVDKVAFHISNDADEVLSRSRLLPGDFLITIAGTLGRVGFVPPKVPHLNCNQAVAFARIDQSKVDVQYLCFACSLEHLIAPLLDQKAGGALQNLNLQQSRCLCIPLPPLQEQQRIAGVLREQMVVVNKSRAAAQARLSAIKALPAAFLRQVFPQLGQPLPNGWRWAKLREVADVVNGFGFAESLQGRTDLPYPFIKVSDMNAPGAEIVIEKAANTVDDEILRHLGARCYPQGTVVFPKVGGALLTNKKRVLGRDSSFDNNIMGVVPRHTESEFLYYWLCTIDMAVHANTQALPSIRQSLVASFEIPLPQMPEQRRIVGVLREQIAAVEKARTAAEAELNTINALPAALLRRAFNGEI